MVQCVPNALKISSQVVLVNLKQMEQIIYNGIKFLILLISIAFTLSYIQTLGTILVEKNNSIINRRKLDKSDTLLWCVSFSWSVLYFINLYS